MQHKRVIVCLDVKDGRVVKGVSFQGLRDMGDPVELAARYEAEGADEIVYLDISASAEGRRTLLDVVRRTAERLAVPLTVGGGVRAVEDVARAIEAGADKVSINTAGVERPELFAEAAARFGAGCIVASVDAAVFPAGADTDADPATLEYRVFTHGGATATALDPVTWAARCAELGAGEILITSIDRDGRRSGFDLELTRRVAAGAGVPVIASGGAGAPEHFRDAFLLAGAAAALGAGIFHEGVTTVPAVKRVLAEAGIAIRPSQGGPT